MTSLRSMLLLVMLFFLAETTYGQIDTTQFSQDTDTLFEREKQIQSLVADTVIPIENTTAKKATPAKKDTVKYHDPKKAALLSLIPGGGQIYNKKYWKLPIVYAGLISAGYFAISYGKKAITYRNEFFFRQHDATEYYKPELQKYNTPTISNYKNTYLKNMEIAIGVFTILYALNIIDALVDAHLFYFDVSDDLSFRITPYMNDNNPFKIFFTGITFSFSLK